MALHGHQEHRKSGSIGHQHLLDGPSLPFPFRGTPNSPENQIEFLGWPFNFIGNYVDLLSSDDFDPE